MPYTHLSRSERYQIDVLRRTGHSLREIGAIVQRSPSTISRELRRNHGLRSYQAREADRLARRRSSECRSRPRITIRQWRGVARLLRLDWSPQQVAERCRLDGTLAISHEWIYAFIYAEKAIGGLLWNSLRVRKKRRKRYAGGRDRRGQIPFRVGIEERGVPANDRLRLGDWEGDTMHGGRAGVVTLVDRKSRFTRLAKVLRRTARQVRSAIRRRLALLGHRVRSLTVDNGREFTDHLGIARDLEADVFFARPYSAWERGTNGVAPFFGPAIMTGSLR